MSTTAADAEVRWYLEAVRSELDDLPLDERDELLEDLEDHLLEVAAEDDGSLRDRLGSPERYAEELRMSAGYPSREDAASPGGARRLADGIARSQPVRAVAAIVESPRFRALRDFVAECAPGWWVLRGYLAVVAIASLNGSGAGRNFPYPRIAGSAATGGVAVLAGILASVWLGRRAQRREKGRFISLVLTFAVAIFGAVTVVNLDSEAYATSPDAGGGVVPYLQQPDGAPIANICPYGTDGKLLSRVLLFDQDGRPIANVVPEAWAGGNVQRAGPAIANSYPLDLTVQDPETGAVRPLTCPPAIGVAGVGAPSPGP